MVLTKSQGRMIQCNSMSKISSFEGLKTLLRGSDMSFKIIEPKPRDGVVTILPGGKFIAETELATHDPIFNGMAEEERIRVLLRSAKEGLATRSRLAIVGFRRDSDVDLAERGNISIITVVYNFHNLFRSAVIHDGEKLAQLNIIPDETCALHGDELLIVALKMQSPNVLLIDSNFKEYSLSAAQAVFDGGNPDNVVFREVGIRLQKKIGILSPGNPLDTSKIKRAWQGLEDDIGLVWENLNDDTKNLAVKQGIILQLTEELIIPNGFVAVAEKATYHPFEPEHGDSNIFQPGWKEDGGLKEIIKEHYIHPDTEVATPRMIRVKFYRDDPNSLSVSNAFK